METKDLYLYKVSHKRCPSILFYAAAENQGQALEKVKNLFDDEPRELSIEYVDIVTV